MGPISRPSSAVISPLQSRPARARCDACQKALDLSLGCLERINLLLLQLSCLLMLAACLRRAGILYGLNRRRRRGLSLSRGGWGRLANAHTPSRGVELKHCTRLQHDQDIKSSDCETQAMPEPTHQRPRAPSASGCSRPSPYRTSASPSSASRDLAVRSSTPHRCSIYLYTRL